MARELYATSKPSVGRGYFICTANPMGGFLCGEAYLLIYVPVEYHFKAKAENKLIQIRRASIFADYKLLKKEGTNPPPAEIVLKYLAYDGREIEFQPIKIDEGEEKNTRYDITKYFAGTGTLASFGVNALKLHVRAHRQWYEIWEYPTAYTLDWKIWIEVAYLVGD